MTRWRSQSLVQLSSTVWAATASMASSASSTSGGTGCHCPPFRSMNITSAAHAALVAIGQRVIPRQPAGEHGGLVHEVGVEVFVAEAGLRGGKGRVREVAAADLHQH